MSELDSTYWTERYESGQTGWDIGHESTPLKEFIDALEDKSIKILIPGCGNAYEAQYLWQKGFENVHLIDLSSTPLENFSKLFPDFPKDQLICGDFFEHDGTYDLILEQTFFCAINPSFRDAYVEQMLKLLVNGGSLVGLLFNFPLTEAGPPFGGSLEEYEQRFTPFESKSIEPCMNSIAPRAGKEFFIHMKKK
ncbi:MAG: methyltransferase domain-containing protein [Flavobacteriales bacterium]